MELNQIIQACQNETNFDELCYLQQVLGPQRQPRNTLIPLTCVYLLLAILGIFGNFSVCFVIFRIPSMRSATNYYLFSLAVADLLILLLGKLYKVYPILISNFSFNMSILLKYFLISYFSPYIISNFSHKYLSHFRELISN